MRLKLLAVSLLLALMSSCTVTFLPNDDADITVRTNVRYGIEVNDIIRVFEPTRGRGSTYFVGDGIAFTVLTREDGYITLTAIDPDGTVYVFARNIFVRGGQQTSISGTSEGSFQIAPPGGLQRVRASFTASRVDTSRVTYRGVIGEDGWTQRIVADIRPYSVRDIAETRFFIQ